MFSTRKAFLLDLLTKNSCLSQERLIKIIDICYFILICFGTQLKTMCSCSLVSFTTKNWMNQHNNQDFTNLGISIDHKLLHRCRLLKGTCHQEDRKWYHIMQYSVTVVCWYFVKAFPCLSKAYTLHTLYKNILAILAFWPWQGSNRIEKFLETAKHKEV